jgi:predicted enzyme related to lactoylglutathione lyase
MKIEQLNGYNALLEAVMTSLKLVVLLLCIFCLGYGTAYVPGLRLPSAATLHRWQPSSELASRPSPLPIQVQGIGWVGTRTPYFDNTVTFFRDVLKLPLTMQSPQFAEFTLAGGERLGISGSKLAETAFMKGPMMEFTVTDVDEARSQLQSVGVQFIGDIHRDAATGLAWTEFWGPDGYPYGLTSAVHVPLNTG